MRAGFDAVVLTGGSGRRMSASVAGGATDVEKAAIEVGGVPLIERALTAVAHAQVVIGVGNAIATTRPVQWIREAPVGSGPAAALAAASAHVQADSVVVLAVDVPFAAPVVVRLLAALAGHDAAVAIDETGRRQPLLAAYTAAALRRRAAAGPWADRSMREFVDALGVVEVPASARETFDCDTAADVTSARRLAGSPPAPRGR